MIVYIFKSESNCETKKMADFISFIKPRINFKIEETHFGKVINCEFENETKKNSFIKALRNALNISEEGRYLR